MTVAPDQAGTTTAGSIPAASRVAFLPLHLMVTGLVLGAGLAAWSFGLHEPRESHDAVALACGFALMGLVIYARYVLRLPWISASVVYLMLFWIFHFGMTFTAALIPDVLVPLEDRAVEWLYWPNVRLAMLLALIGATGFVFGVGLFGPRSLAGDRRDHEKLHLPNLYTVGWLVMMAGIAGSMITVAQTVGLGVFSIGYMNFLSLVGSTRLGATINLAQLGCLLAVCGAGGRRWMPPLLVWGALMGVPMMLLGARSAMMIPLVGFAIVLTYRGVRLPRGLVAAGVLIALVAIPAVQAFRIVGFGNRALVSWTEITPLDTLVEMGGSLRAAKAYVDWIEEGDEYLLGAGYWAPFDRQVLTRILPDRLPIPYEQDTRIPQRLMVVREGAVGTSSIGEAYYNFGLLGPFLYLAILGGLFGWLERHAPASPYVCAVLGVVVLLFYFNIRGDWLAIPARLAAGLALIAACYALGSVSRARQVAG